MILFKNMFHALNRTSNGGKIIQITEGEKMTQDQTKPEIRMPMPHGAVDDPAWQTPFLDAEDQERKAEIDRVLDPAEAMKEHPDTKNLTLGEIKARDEDNLRLVLQSAREHRFETLQAAMNFLIMCLGKVMEKFKITAHGQGAPMPDTYTGALTAIPGNLYVPGQTKMDIIKEQMVKAGIRQEVRSFTQYPPNEKWKAGIYFYYKGEIAYFISNPMMDTNTTGAGGRIVIPHEMAQRYFVRTNVPI
jgi:hypothetical protein